MSICHIDIKLIYTEYQHKDDQYNDPLLLQWHYYSGTTTVSYSMGLEGIVLNILDQ